MEKFNYSKDELKVFEKALKTVLDDLESLWELKAFDHLRFNVDLPGISSCGDKYYENGWSFVMDKDGFYLLNPNCDQIINFVTINKFGYCHQHLKIHPRDIVFLREYDKIREKIVTHIENVQSAKNKDLDMAESIINRYSKNAVVEIALPETNNQQTIEVVEENGRKVGTLNFGDISLKIISNANIEFKSTSTTSEKVKRK